MSIGLTWYGHGSWMIESGEHKILLDPFLDDNPSSPVKASEVEADFILVSHGHFDHVADVASIANRCGATVVAIYEIAEWFSKNHSVETTIGMNLGGQVDLPFGLVKMTPAVHSSQLPDGSYGGEPAGFVLTISNRRIYFACDTALFSDMKLLSTPKLDIAVLPIGDLFTMGVDDSVVAAQWLEAEHVLPAHYNTWPPIAQDADAWADKITRETSSKPHVIKPGEQTVL